MELVVTLFVLGTILIVAETVLPGLVAGILGALCLLGGVIAGYVEFGAHTGNRLLIAVTVAFVGGLALWVRFFPDSRFGRVFISKGAVGGIRAEKPELLHQTGVAFTPLRPSGTALINGKRVDVVTEGGLIDKDTPLKVIAIEGMRVVVRAISATDSAASPTASVHSPQTKTT
jgi:membrane-bound serine protease (ClpP class)